MPNNIITPQWLAPHGSRTISNTGVPFGIRTYDLGDSSNNGPICVLTVDQNGNYVSPGGGGGSGSSPAVESYYQVAASTTAQTIVIKNSACTFYGIENLSTTDLTGVTITVYDNATTGSGNIIGNYSLGASQKIERANGLSCLNGITIVIAGGSLHSDGGVNVFYANTTGGSTTSTSAVVESYTQVAGGTAPSVISIYSGSCLFYGIENLSTSDLTGITITVYDNPSGASGNIIGQFQMGASQSIERAFGVQAATGVTIQISGGTLPAIGGLNVLYSAIVSGVPYEKYSQLGASTAIGTYVISSRPVNFYGVENLSISDVVGAQVTIYDSASTASGNILGQYYLGASQLFERRNALLPKFGIVVSITGSSLNSDGGLNVLHA